MSAIACHLQTLCLEMRAELPPRIVESLVQSAARRAQPVGQDVDRDAVERDRDQHAALMRRELAADGVTDGANELALLRAVGHAQAAIDQSRLVRVVERHLA